MSTDCWNTYTVIGNPGDVYSLYEEGLQGLRQTNPIVMNEDIDQIRILQRRERGVRFVYKSQWNPNTPWMEHMLERYPSLWMKNEWSDEGGRSGIIIGGVLYGRHYPLQEFRWDDVLFEDEFHPARRIL